jgi:uncharacterized protein YjeT (DUF2065 family)
MKNIFEFILNVILGIALSLVFIGIFYGLYLLCPPGWQKLILEGIYDLMYCGPDPMCI